MKNKVILTACAFWQWQRQVHKMHTMPSGCLVMI